MGLNPNRGNTDFTFRHKDQVDEYGNAVAQSGGDFTDIQDNYDSRCEDNLTDINNIKDTLRSTTDSDSGADNVSATVVGAGTSETVQGILEEIDSSAVKLTGNQSISGTKTFSDNPIIPDPTLATHPTTKNYVDTEIAGVVLGQIPDNSLTNAKLVTDIKVGSLSALTTTDKSNVTNAINEVNQSVSNRDAATDGQVLTSNGDGTATYETVVVPDGSVTNDKLATDVKVGSLATLNTTDKTSVTNAINESNQLVTNKGTATDGQVLTSNGDGTATYETISVATDFVLLDSRTLSSSVNSYNVTGLSTSGYSTIMVDFEGGFSDFTNDQFWIEINGVASSNYGWQALDIGGASVTASSQSSQNAHRILTTLTNENRVSARIIIQDNGGTNKKIISNAGFDVRSSFVTGYGNVSGNITSLRLYVDFGETISSGSTIKVYGLN